jgi:hypothetical protein
MMNKESAVEVLKVVDWNRVFQTIHSSDGLKRNQTRPLRTEFVEKSIEKRSKGKLKYTGDKTDGMDYINNPDDGTRYECKLMHGIWRKCGTTPKFILKNFRKNSNPEIKKTFDYMILVDSKNKKVGLCTFEDLNTYVNDATVEFNILQEKIVTIADNITIDETDTTDFEKIIMDSINRYL